MSKIDQLVKTIVKAIDEKDRKKTSALDTVATVSRIDGDTAWVKFAGSDSETPVKQTIAVKKGDKVQVRASKGSAWITGNITSPPTDNTLAEEAVKKSDTATKRAKRAEDMSIVADVMYYLASDQDEGVTTEDEGWTQEPQEATVALPYLWCYHEYTRGNGTKFNSDPVIIGHYTEGGAGITAVQPQYYLSTSSTSCTGGTWGETFTYLSGYYIWTREKITLSDSTVTYSTPIYSQALTETCSLSYNSAQYFWTKSSGGSTAVPTGSYVTEVSRSSYESSPSGGSVLIKSAGVYIRNAAKSLVELVAAGLKIYEPTEPVETSGAHPVAQFLSSGAIIGKENSNNVRVDSSGLRYYSSSTEKGRIVASTTGIRFLNNSGSTWVDLGNNFAEVNGGGSAVVTVNRTQVSIADPTDTYTTPLSVTGKATLGALNNSIFDTTSVSLSKSSATAGTNYEIPSTSGQTGTSKSGYFPLGVVGYSVVTSGAYSRGAYLSSQSSGACTVKAKIHAETAGTKNCTVTVLWLKTTA